MSIKKLNWSQIIEGWRNHLFPKKEIEALISETSKERLDICRDCPFNTTKGSIKINSRCSACGCPLLQKTKCLSCTCGIQDYNDERVSEEEKLTIKWLPVLTPEQENIITDDINT